MATFDYDVVIIGSGFGGSVAALRAAEKGYRVGVMEAGGRWKDEDIPKTNWNLPSFLWLPAAEMYGMQRLEYLDNVLVLCGAGAGGGSHIYGNTLYVPPKQFFDAPAGQASPTGPTNWRRVSTRQAGCSASFVTRTCRLTSTATCSRLRSKWGEGNRSTRPRWVSISAARRPPALVSNCAK
jgi:choline dehydrogenase-like flavoprotein